VENRSYIAIDLKSFYASAECASLGHDPLATNLVVADITRTEKTICLAVSPSLKAYGISGRARLFEVVQRVREINAERKRRLQGGSFSGTSVFAPELENDPTLELGYITARPRMAYYIEVSTAIYKIYLRYIAPEDIHVYSVDEVFIDVTNYLPAYKMTSHELARRMISDVLAQTGITATAGIGTNMYLAKVAMDIVAKHIPADKDGVRIAELDEMSYREKLWSHTPITDFWRVGKGYAARLERLGICTMGDVAYCSVKDEEKLYRTFGVNAELLIDHAWGYEPCRISDIKSYKPENNSLSVGQVLQEPYSFDLAKLVIREMTDGLSLELVEKKLVADQIIITVGYESVSNGNCKENDTTLDRYGRITPKPAHGTAGLGRFTSSSRIMTDAVDELFGNIVKRNLLVRRMYVVANHVIPETDIPDDDDEDDEEPFGQLSLFTEKAKPAAHSDPEIEHQLEREKSVQKALIDIKKKFGSNSVVKAMDLEEGATAMERNRQIGGHRA